MELRRWALFIFTACIALQGCVESTGDEARYQNLEETCEPGEYDDCTTISADSLVDPAESEGAWRSVEANAFGSQNVEIDVHELNGGMLPTSGTQGHYDSMDELRNRIQAVLQIDLESEDAFGRIVQTGRTVKYDRDPDDPSFGSSSTGALVCDAITDADGKLFVAGDELSVDCGRSELNYGIGDETENATTSGTGMLRISGGDDEAEFEAFSFDIFVYKSLGSEIFNYKRNGRSSRWRLVSCYNGWWRCWQKRRVTTTMSISNSYFANDRFVPDPGDFAFEDSVVRQNVDSLKLKEWWVGAGVCADEWGNAQPCGSGIDAFGPINTVCASAIAGLASGNDGTSSACIE